MAALICPNCGKKHRWFEAKKIDPITKEHICRKCNSPLSEKDRKQEPSQQVFDSPFTPDSEIKKLVNEIIQSFNQMRKHQKDITHPSIPILYFGDYPQYQKSYPKVITVGLNPSRNEFPPTFRFTRFIESEKLELSNTLNENEITTYLNSLNTYFTKNPHSWFDSYNPILKGMNTSYYANITENRALHTDFCSPFATETSWGKLRDSTKYTLSREGRKFWHRLVEILEPDAIIFSITRKYRDHIMFKKSGWRLFTSITKKKDGTPRSKPYDVDITESRIGDRKMYLVYGQPAYLPFGSLSKNVRTQLGLELGRLFN